jgi:hypothetical protein
LTLQREHPFKLTMAKNKEADGAELIKTWTLLEAATLGSSIRTKGILQDIRARLLPAIRKSLDVIAEELTLLMPATSRAEFRAASVVISEALKDVESLPTIPRKSRTS